METRLEVPNKTNIEKPIDQPQQALLEKINPGESTTHVNKPYTTPPMKIESTATLPPETHFSRTGP